MKENFDPSLNFLYRRQRVLDHIFRPKKVALIGATETEKSVGRTLMQNLMNPNFEGEIIPINPKRESVLGVKAYPNLQSAPKEIDLAVIVTPSKTVPQLIRDCAEVKIPAAVIISAGFREIGEAGILLEQEILQTARSAKMRIIGPNCLGVMNPNIGLNATFAAGIAKPGKIAFISQSGALCTAVLDWSLHENIGFSAFVSIGAMADVGWGDLINYFGNDPGTESILIYMESIGNPKAFLSAAREVALTKPIILIKAGRTAESAKAAASHTGALAGSDEVFNASLERVGVLRVDTIADLFGMAEVIGKQPYPKGPNLTIVTNAGGPGVIATDALIESGGKLTEISKEKIDELGQFLPPSWSHNNPIDVLGDANAEKYAQSVEIAIKDPNANGICVILTPQDMTDSTGTAAAITKYQGSDKTLLASWMGADSVAKGSKILKKASIPVFSYPDFACKMFGLMWKHADQLKSLYEIPIALDNQIEHAAQKKSVESILKKVKGEKRTLLDEYESKQILEAYHIPTVPTQIATSAEEAAKIGEKMGFPIVLKLYSKTITHKTDVGGVQLNIQSKEEIKQKYDLIFSNVKKMKGESHFQGVTVQPMIKLGDGYELIIGSSQDPEFGPVLLFGFGGQLVEVFKDRSLALPPLTQVLARKMMEKTKIFEALKGVRGRKSVDLQQLEALLVRFSLLIIEQPSIKELDINPLFVSDEKIIALDARVILHEENTLSIPVIRPYPIEYVKTWKTANGKELTFRPIRPEDEPLIKKFHQDLSQETVRQRFLKIMHYEERVARDRLVRICFADYDREIALLAEYHSEIVGVIRLTKIPGTKDAKFGLIVKDGWQHLGIGRELMGEILKIAKKENVEFIAAAMLEENFQMQKLLNHFGFSFTKEEKYLIATKSLR